MTETEQALLRREGHLSASLLGSALTEIRRYDYSRIGYLYHALFGLVNGVERLMKITYILDHHGRTGACPTNEELRGLGHDIGVLYLRMESIALDRSLTIEAVPDPEINAVLLSVLTEFGKQTRYYNLNSLVGARPTDVDPIARWDAELMKLILEKHPPRTKPMTDIERALVAGMEEVSAVAFINERGDPITDVQSMVEAGRLVPNKQKYGMFYCYALVRRLANTLGELEHSLSSKTFLREYYAILRNPDDTYVKSRKTWDQYKP